MTITGDGPRRLVKGANVALRELEAELGAMTVVLETRGEAGRSIDADVSVLLLGRNGKVRTNDDLIFYNQPIGLGGAVHLRDKVRPEVSAEEDEVLISDVVTLELDDVSDEIERIVVSASLDPGTGLTFGDASGIAMRVQRTSDATDLLVFDIGDVTTEAALVFGEFYRRDGAWRVRAIGQGYAGGLAALVADYGVEVLAEPTDDTDAPAAERGQPPSDELLAHDSTDSGAAPPVSTGPTVDEEPTIGESGRDSVTKRQLSVRRPTRAPKLPADWDASIPADDGNDWQPARLFPVAGIGGGEEQERRATSALLAVMRGVREFARALTLKCGAPAGTVSTFIEVPFGQGEEAYRPDGVIRVTRGQKEWTGLVEVKTSAGRLREDQIDHYVDIARSRGFDAVITISNELTGAGVDHPLNLDRRKLRKVSLAHLSWDQVRAQAILVARHRGVADPTQRWVLEEFIRYLSHARSGTTGLTDMGPSWVRVRDSVKAKTARSSDKAIADVSARFDQLVEHVSLQLSGILGVEVQSMIPRNAPDTASRCQQLADSGLLFGSIRVPGAVDLIVLNADLRADRVSASLTVVAPRRETRALTRINWLLRQLPDSAPESIRVEAALAGGRGASTAALLGKVRAQPDVLIPTDQREIRAFRLSLDEQMGTKRASGTGTLIHSVKTVTTTFYGQVVQHLRPWTSSG